jgi:pimeloyl-ACP methyl ester carboxylesterase
MNRETVTYFSQSQRVSAYYYRPTTAQDRAPALVFCPGFTGTKLNPLYDIFLGPLTEAGYGVLVPDHRGWGESEGEPGAIYPLDQVADLRAGLSYLETRSDVAANRLGLFGVSFGGGNATYTAAVDSRVRAAVAVSAVGDGYAWLRGMRREYEWWDFLDTIADDRRQRALTGESRLVDPTEEIMIASPERKALKGAGLAARTPLACADAILDYRPVQVAHLIAPRAMLWLCLAADPVVPADLSRAMYAAAGEPKKLVVLPGAAHYAGYEQFQPQIVGHSLDWFERYLRSVDEIEVQEAASR